MLGIILDMELWNQFQSARTSKFHCMILGGFVEEIVHWSW